MTDVAGADPFELPDWLGEADVVWRALDTVAGADKVRGALVADQQLVHLDLLAVDAAWPRPICDEVRRTEAHLAWHHGEVLLLTIGDRTTLAVPGFAFDAECACEAIRRFARAVGARPTQYAVQLHL